MNMQEVFLKITAYIEAYNQKNVPLMLQFLADDVQFTHITDGTIVLQLKNKAAFEQQANTVLPWFLSRTQTVQSFNYSKQSTIVNIHFTATVAIDLPIGLKAGETIATNVKTIFTFNQGLINSITDIQ